MLVILRAAVAALLAAVAIGAAAQPVADGSGAPAAPAAGPTLTLAEALQRTLSANPELAAFGPRLDALRALEDEAALDPPFTLSAEIEDFLGTGSAHAFDRAQTTLALSRAIELGDRRAHRMNVAAATSELAAIERTAAELDALAEVARRFIHVAADQDHLALTRRATSLAADTVAGVEARVAAARAPDVELRRARVVLARARIEEEHAEHELLASRRKLAAMWGSTQDDFAAVSGDLYALPAPAAFETLVARLERSPDWLAFASEARLRDAELRLAESRARPDLVARAGLRHLQDTGDEAFVIGVDVPLFGRERSRSAAAAADARRRATAAELAAHRVRAEAQLFEIYQELRHAVTEADALRTAILPEMEAALAATRTAYESGRYSYLEWTDAQRELIDVQRSLIDAAADAHLYRTEIERLTSAPLPTTGAPRTQP